MYIYTYIYIYLSIYLYLSIIEYLFVVVRLPTAGFPHVKVGCPIPIRIYPYIDIIYRRAYAQNDTHTYIHKYEWTTN